MINDCLKSLRINPGNLPNRSFAKKDGGSAWYLQLPPRYECLGREAVSGIDSRNLLRLPGLQAAISFGMVTMA